MIYQVHPQHGHHYAMTPQEARENEKNGWKTVTEKEFYSRTKKKEADEKPEGKK